MRPTRARSWSSARTRRCPLLTPSRRRRSGRTGPVSNATFLNFPISDKASLQVNVGSGNALFTTSDITLPEIAGGLILGNDYNSLLTGSVINQGADRNGWRQREGVDVRLYLGSDGTITLLGEDGTAGTFTAPPTTGTAAQMATYGSPAVFHATLTSALTSACSGSAYQLTWHSSGEVMCFNGAGLLTSQADRNGNTTAFSYNGSGQETQVAYTPEGLSSPTETVTTSYTSGYLTGLSEFGGSTGTKTVSYTINSSGDLTSVQQPDDTTITLRRRRPARARRVRRRARRRRPCGAGSPRPGGLRRWRRAGRRWCGRRTPRPRPIRCHLPRATR
jgi:YD repeat-containing protein